MRGDNGKRGEEGGNAVCRANLFAIVAKELLKVGIT
jgi:hypothetical protein